MDFFDDAQSLVMLLLGIGAFALEVFAFVDAMRRPAAAFAATGSQTKVTWLVITGVAMAVGFVKIPYVLDIFGLLAIVGAAVYVVQVRPKVRSIGGRGPKPPSRNGW